MRYVAFDCETFPMGAETGPYPPVVCVSSKWDDGDEQFTTNGEGGGDLQLYLHVLALLAPGHILIGHNVQYDLHCILTTFPDLWEKVWEKLMAGEIVDTEVRERLWNLATHGQLDFVRLPDGSDLRISYSLAELQRRHLGVDRSEEKGEDSWRTNYHLLSGQPRSRWPKEAIEYALDDARGTLNVYNVQETDAPPEAWKTQFFRTGSSFALGCCTRNGMRVDKAALKRLMDRVERDNVDTNFPTMIEAGILLPAAPARPYLNGAKNPDGTPKMKAAEPSKIKQDPLKKLVAHCYSQRGLSVPQTDGEDVSISYDTINEVKTDHEALAEWVKRDEDRKLISTYIPQAIWNGQPVDYIFPPFKSLVSTGRTSSGSGGRHGKGPLFPSMNGQNQDPRFRPVMVPRPDRYICSADFKSLELVTTAQVTFKMCGFSKHRDKINAGFDLHAFLGSRLAAFLDPQLAYLLPMDDDARYHAFLVLSKGSKAEKTKYKYWRKFAKPVGLGFPGGLGAEKFVTFAGNAPYEINLRVLAREYLHLFQWNSSLHYYGTRLKLVRRGEGGKQAYWKQAEPTAEAFADGFRIEDPKTWPPHLQAIALAAHLKELWFDTYPEMRRYFQLITQQVDELNSEPEVEGADDHERKVKFFYTTPLGMVRRGCDYAAAANGCCMQSPGAEGALLAMIEYAQACTDPSMGSILYGTNPLSFIHDELLGEVWEDLAHEQAMEIKAIMERGLKKVCPDVNVEAAPCLMLRWDKMAEPVYEDGRLALWFPEDRWAAFEPAMEVAA